jgi:regulatory protein
MSKIVSLNEVLKEIEATPEKRAPKKKKREKQLGASDKYKTTNKYDRDRNTKKKKSSKLGFTKRDNHTRCKSSAIYSLAMREHSRLEIKNKLKKKDYVEGVDLEKLLDELEESNYLNEERFVESFIRYRSGRGQGFIKISNELRQRGIKASMIQSAMQEAEIDWFQLAKEQREKKFGLKKPKDFKEKARQMRFLFGRGFETETIRQVL